MNFEDSIRKLLEQEYKKRIELNNGKYTELQFAKDLGLGKDSMHTYLTGKRVPNADSLVRIAKGLNVSVDYLLGLSNKKSIEPTEDEKAFARVSELTGLSVEALNVLYRLHGESSIYIEHGADSHIFMNKKSFELLSYLICYDDFYKLLDSMCTYFDFNKENTLDKGLDYYLSAMKKNSIENTFKISDLNTVESLFLNNISKILEQIKYNYKRDNIFDTNEMNMYFSIFDEYVKNSKDIADFINATKGGKEIKEIDTAFNSLMNKARNIEDKLSNIKGK